MRTPGSRKQRVIPGFGLTLGITLAYASIIVLIPLATLFLKAGTLTWAQFLEAAASPRALASYRVTFLASFLAAMSAWSEDMEGFYENSGEDLASLPPWRVLADILMAARVYE